MADESTEFSQFIAAADAADEPSEPAATGKLEAKPSAALDDVDGLDDASETADPPDPEDVKADAATPEQAKAEEKAAAKFALLARRDLALRQREGTIKARESRLAQLEEFARQVSTEDGAIAWLESRDPKLYEKWTRRIVGMSQAPDPNDIAQQALREVQALRERDAKREADLSHAQTQQVLAQHQLEINRIVGTDPRYKLITAFEVETDVMATIEAYYDKTQKVLTIEEAADIVEGALRKKHERALGVTKSNAATSDTQGTEPKATASSGKRSPQTQTNKTVTQRMKSAVPRRPVEDAGDTSDAAWQRHLKSLGM